MKRLIQIFCGLLLASQSIGQKTELAVFHQVNEDELDFLLFENEGESLQKIADSYTLRTIEFTENHPKLNLAGDFDGDGLDEIAVFTSLLYTPNMNPAYTSSLIKIYKSSGDQLKPHNTWFSALDTHLDFAFVNFSIASDFNRDGLTDIALIYNDPTSEQQQVYVLESTGEGFSEPILYFVTDRNEFNFTALSFACAGDFNGNGYADIALFYNYFGTAPETRQSIFLFESNGTAFTLLPAAFIGTRQESNFSEMKFVLAGDYNQDGISDLAVIREDASGQNVEIPVFQGSVDGQLTPEVYLTIPSSSMDLSGIEHALAGEFSGDQGADLALFMNDSGTGGQEIQVLKSEEGEFNSPVKLFVSSPELLLFKNFTTVLGGKFVHELPIMVTTWKDDMKGAISFTFDDGAKGAFEHGAAELEDAGLKGTFYIFTDTASAYDSELAGSALIQEYRNKGHEIGSHTHNHSNLGHLTESGDLDSLSGVLSTSVDLLNKRFDQQTFCLSIPYGSFRYETVDYIAQYFQSARSSQYGYNLATPYDFYALRSWPILSTTSPAYVSMLVSRASKYGYYLPLMYHDMTDEPFDEEANIYNYSRELFRETINEVSTQDVWIDTHERIYKYIRERNALKIDQLHMEDAESQPGQFSFVLSDGLPDSVFNVELTLKIRLPETWNGEYVSFGVGDSLTQTEVLWEPKGNYVLYNSIPVEDRKIQVYEGIKSATSVKDKEFINRKIELTAYPNPFSAGTQIHLEGQLHPQMQLMLLDIHGRKLQDFALQGQTTIPLGGENLSPGIYILLLHEGGVPLSSLKLMVR